MFSEILSGSWRLGAGGWKLEAGSWKLEAGSWMLEVGSWKLEFGIGSRCALLSGFRPSGLTLVTGHWSLVTGH